MEAKKGRGRPKGTGPKMVSVQELIELIGEDGQAPVPYKWLEALGANPTEYSPWNRKVIKSAPVQAPAPVVAQEEEEEEENDDKIEWTLS